MLIVFAFFSVLSTLLIGGFSVAGVPSIVQERMDGFCSSSTAFSPAGKFPWPEYKNFVDVGAAQGDTAARIAIAHPHLNGTAFDLPEVAPIFEEYVESLGISQRLRFAAGNFLEGRLPSADVIVMGHVLHDWDLDTQQMLIGKAYDALPTSGGVHCLRSNN
jgi:hypothetical protein